MNNECSTLHTFRSSPPEMFLRKDVLKICSIITGEHSCRSMISIKLQSNFSEITLRQGSSPVHLLHILIRLLLRAHLKADSFILANQKSASPFAGSELNIATSSFVRKQWWMCLLLYQKVITSQLHCNSYWNNKTTPQVLSLIDHILVNCSQYSSLYLHVQSQL